MNKIAKVITKVSYLVIIAGIIVLLGGHWVITLVCLVVAGIMNVVGYRMAGGAENAELYAGLDLPGLVGYAVTSGNARIGFHSLGSQETLVERMCNHGVNISAGNVREEIRRAVVKDRGAFEACRDLMVIQTVRGGREHFWDGFGTPKPVQWFHEAEIIIDFQPSTDALARRLFEVMSEAQ